MDSFINKLTEGTTVKKTDYTVFDVADTTTGSFSTQKISYASFTKQLSSDITDGIKTLITGLETKINEANTTANSKLDKKGLTLNSNEKMSGTLSVLTLCATNIAHFNNTIDVHNNFISNVKDPILDYDAVNKHTLLSAINGLSIPGAGTFLAKSGDTMTAGNLTLSAEPTVDKHATTKFYVDAEVTKAKNLIPNVNSLLTNYIPLSGGTMTGGFITQATDTAPTDDKHLANKKYVDTQITTVNNNGMSKTLADTTYIAKAGGTMTGSLYLTGAPSTNNEASNKKYVDDAKAAVITSLGSYLTTSIADSTYLKKSGDIMTAGNLTLSSEPLSAKHAVTKKYVDDAITTVSSNGMSKTIADTTYIAKAGGTMTGSLYLTGAPTSNNEASNKKYVDDSITNLNLATNYLNKTDAGNTYLKKSGDIMTAGNLTLSAIPTDAKHATTKSYVDGAITTATANFITSTTGDTTYVKKAGDTMLGSLVVKGFSEKTGTSMATGSVALDLNLSSTFPITLGGNITGFTISNAPTDSFSITLIITQSTLGNNTVAFTFTGYTVKWSGASAPTMTATANKTDIFCFTRIGTTIYAFNGGQNF
jgi:hypothetical protein